MILFSFAGVAYSVMAIVRQIFTSRLVLTCLAPLLFVAVELRMHYDDFVRWILRKPTDFEIVKSYSIDDSVVRPLSETELCTELAYPSMQKLIVFYRFCAANKTYAVIINPLMFDVLRDDIVPYTPAEVQTFLSSDDGDEHTERYLSVMHDDEDVTDSFNIYAGPKGNWHKDVKYAVHNPALMVNLDGTWVLTGVNKHISVLTEKGLRELDVQVFSDTDNDSDAASDTSCDITPSDTPSDAADVDADRAADTTSTTDDKTI